MDEVLTGFRVTGAGWYGIDRVRGDLVTFGKVMGGGLPCAAFGGRAEVMSRLAPVGPVYQAGTLSGNPLATAAGLATLRACTPDVYGAVDSFAHALRTHVSAVLEKEGVPHYLSTAGSLFTVFLGRTEPVRGLRRRQGPVHRRVRRVLPRHARRRRLPSAVRLRGLVRLRRARRGGPLPGRRRAARGRPRRRPGARRVAFRGPAGPRNGPLRRQSWSPGMRRSRSVTLRGATIGAAAGGAARAGREELSDGDEERYEHAEPRTGRRSWGRGSSCTTIPATTS